MDKLSKKIHIQAKVSQFFSSKQKPFKHKHKKVSFFSTGACIMGLGNVDIHKTSTQVCALKIMIIIHMVFKKKINWISPYTHYSMKLSHTTHKNAYIYIYML
jgi:hypothetical protein